MKLRLGPICLGLKFSPHHWVARQFIERESPREWAILLIAGIDSTRYFTAMSTLAEIQEAVTGLPADEKKALSLWLNSQTAPLLSAADEQRLLHSLDEAIRDVDAGQGVPIEDVRKRVASWVAK